MRPNEVEAARLAETPLTFVGTRTKAGRIAVTSVAFVLLGTWEMSQRGTWLGIPVPAAGAAALVLGLLGTAVALGLVFRPTTLVLTDRGFLLRTLSQSSHLQWSEIERFRAWRPTRFGPTMVGYDRRGQPRTRAETLARGLGCDGAIPDQFAIPPPELLALCEACRQRWG